MLMNEVLLSQYRKIKTLRSRHVKEHRTRATLIYPIQVISMSSLRTNRFNVDFLCPFMSILSFCVDTIFFYTAKDTRPPVIAFFFSQKSLKKSRLHLLFPFFNLSYIFHKYVALLCFQFHAVSSISLFSIFLPLSKVICKIRSDSSSLNRLLELCCYYPSQTYLCQFLSLKAFKITTYLIYYVYDIHFTYRCTLLTHILVKFMHIRRDKGIIHHLIIIIMVSIITFLTHTSYRWVPQ